MYGWQWGMFAPGIVGVVMGALILLGVRDSPEASECVGKGATGCRYCCLLVERLWGRPE